MKFSHFTGHRSNLLKRAISQQPAHTFFPSLALFSSARPSRPAVSPSATDTNSFHAALQSCIESGNSRWALVLFRQFLQSNLIPNDFTFALLIKASSSSSSPVSDSIDIKREVPQIQTHLIKLGFDRFVYLTTALLCFYGEFGCISSAQKLFDAMPDRDVVSWNALISAYSRGGYDLNALKLFVHMLKEAFRPSQTTLVSLAPSCGCNDLASQGEAIHAFGIKAGLDCDPRVKNALTSMYAKCNNMRAAELLFEDMLDKTVVSWNAMISAYGQNGLCDEAMIVFKRMLGESVAPNAVTIVSLLSANAHPYSAHCYAIKTGFTANASVVTSLVCIYSMLGNTEYAEMLYRSLPEKKLICLTAILSSYADKEDMPKVIECFSEMLNVGVKPDAVALVSILQVFTNPSCICTGQAFHGFGLKCGFCLDSLLVNGLMSMYTKFGDLEAVFTLFFGLQQKTLISWNSMISSFLQAGRPGDALDLFRQMKILEYTPDAVTLSSLLCGCSQLGYLYFGEKLHNYVLRNNLEVEDFVGTALIDMYAKCGSIQRAEKVFRSLKGPGLASFNSMISGYSLHGLEHEGLSCYFVMRELGLKPDSITFLGVLSACTHRGLIHEGRKYFQIMKEEFGLVPGLLHYTCIVNLLGRAGLLYEAFMFINNMEIEPDSTVWGALLGACCTHQEFKLGESLAKKLFFLDCNSGGFYILMSNLYAIRERWEDVARVREMMRDTGGDGGSGTSLVEVAFVENKMYSGVNYFNWNTNSCKPIFL